MWPWSRVFILIISTQIISCLWRYFQWIHLLWWKGAFCLGFINLYSAISKDYLCIKSSFTKCSNSKTKYLLQLQGLLSVVSLTMETTLHRKLACTGKLQSVFPFSLAYFISYTIPKVPMSCFWTDSLYTFWISLSMHNGAPVLYRMRSYLHILFFSSCKECGFCYINCTF